MKTVTTNVGIISQYAIKGRKSQLKKFEQELKEAGYEGVISNETARGNPHCKFIILYEDNRIEDDIRLLYAYRTDDGSKSSRRPPKIVSISKMRKILNKS